MEETKKQKYKRVGEKLVPIIKDLALKEHLKLGEIVSILAFLIMSFVEGQMHQDKEEPCQ